jgi:hypothetical protein
MLTQSRRLALPFGFSIAPSCHSQRPQQRAAWLLVFWLAPFSPRLCRALCVCVVCVNRSGIWRYGHDMDPLPFHLLCYTYSRSVISI